MTQTKKLFIVGSLAFDHLMRYEGIFQEKLLPEHLHALSVSFGVSGRKTSFGGCGGNIAFHYKKCGGEPLLYGLAGKDFTPYEKWFKKHGIDTSFISKKENGYTSAAFVVTDQKDHQIAIFDEGAAKEFTFDDLVKLRNMVVTHREEIWASIIAPTSAELMKTALLMCVELKIPYFFDPGQAIIKFSKDDLRKFIENACGIFTNEYEMQFLLKVSGFSRSELEKNCAMVLETLGAAGSLITYQGKRIAIEAVRSSQIKNPTGCGDAYRAGFLSMFLKNASSFGLTAEFDKKRKPRSAGFSLIEKAGSEGSRLGSYVLSIEGTQG